MSISHDPCEMVLVDDAAHNVHTPTVPLIRVDPQRPNEFLWEKKGAGTNSMFVALNLLVCSPLGPWSKSNIAGYLAVSQKDTLLKRTKASNPLGD